MAKPTKPPAFRSGVTQQQIQRNLKRIANDLPKFYEKRQARVDLRNKLLNQQYANHHAREYEKLLGHYTELMGPHARAEELRLRAQAQAKAHFDRVFGSRT